MKIVSLESLAFMYDDPDEGACTGYVVLGESYGQWLYYRHDKDPQEMVVIEINEIEGFYVVTTKGGKQFKLPSSGFIAEYREDDKK